MAKAFELINKDIPLVEASFKKLTPSLQRQVTRKVVGAMSTLLKGEYRKRTPRSKLTGTHLLKGKTKQWGGGKDQLKKAITDKRSPKWKNQAAIRKAGIIGVAAGYDYTKGSPKAANYAHLVNDGHVAVYWGNRGGGIVKGLHWQKVARAAAASKGKSVVASKAKAAVTAAVLKVAKKG
jgi:hypothetical protein